MKSRRYNKLIMFTGVALGLSTGVLSNLVSGNTVNANTLANTPWMQDNRGVNFKIPVQSDHAVKYYVDSSNNALNRKVWKYAVNQWNNLNILHFQETQNQDDTNTIVFHSDNSKDNGLNDYDVKHNGLDGSELGMTNSFATMDGDTNQVESVKSTCYLLSGVGSLSLKERERTATHELGHALGFDHDNRVLKNHHFTMSTYSYGGKYYNVGRYEKRALQAHYN